MDFAVIDHTEGCTTVQLIDDPQSGVTLVCDAHAKAALDDVCKQGGGPASIQTMRQSWSQWFFCSTPPGRALDRLVHPGDFV